MLSATCMNSAISAANESYQDVHTYCNTYHHVILHVVRVDSDVFCTTAANQSTSSVKNRGVLVRTYLTTKISSR